jgi:hypothetical protein
MRDLVSVALVVLESEQLRQPVACIASNRESQQQRARARSRNSSLLLRTETGARQEPHAAEQRTKRHFSKQEQTTATHGSRLGSNETLDMITCPVVPADVVFLNRLRPRAYHLRECAIEQ